MCSIRRFALWILAAALIAAAGGCSDGSDDREQPASSQTQPGSEKAAARTNPHTVPASTAPAERLAAGSADTGQQLYDHYCVHCHAAGPGHPGTQMLEALYGAEKAVIKGREDLTVEYIKTVVRNGLLEMSPFRPTEITDAELDALVQYVRAP